VHIYRKDKLTYKLLDQFRNNCFQNLLNKLTRDVLVPVAKLVKDIKLRCNMLQAYCR